MLFSFAIGFACGAPRFRARMLLVRNDLAFESGLATGVSPLCPIRFGLLSPEGSCCCGIFPGDFMGEAGSGMLAATLGLVGASSGSF